MGLRTTNYELKKLGMVIPEAYAVVKKLRVEDGKGIAEFAVQSSRDKALTLAPMETAEVTFDVDRNESPYITAYREAKSQRQDKRFNYETHTFEEVTVDMPFHGWEDDIIVGE